MGGNLLGHDSLTLTEKVTVPTVDAFGNSNTAETEVKVGSSTTSFGLASAGFGPGVGYGLSDSLLLNAQLSFTTSKQDFDDHSDPIESSGFSLLGGLAFLVNDGAARFHLGPALGFQSASATSAGTTTSLSDILVGGEVGVLGFIAPSISIDPKLSLLYVTGSQETSVKPIDTGLGQTATPDSLKADRSGFTVLLGFSLSGWLGSSAPLAVAAPAAPHDDASPDESSKPEGPESYVTPQTGLHADRHVVTLTIPVEGEGDEAAPGAASFGGVGAARTGALRFTGSKAGLGYRAALPMAAGAADCQDLKFVFEDGTETALKVLKASRTDMGILVAVGPIARKKIDALGAASGKVQLDICGSRRTVRVPPDDVPRFESALDQLRGADAPKPDADEAGSDESPGDASTATPAADGPAAPPPL
jgi:hypothetical protein